MPRIRVSSVLPFPLRVQPTPYDISWNAVPWSLVVRRVERRYPDERLAGVGTHDIDLRVDRGGQLAFSEVDGQTHADLAHHEALTSFLSALNVLIAQARDALGYYWIRQLEPVDLYVTTIEVGDQGKVQVSPARGGAFTLAVIGITDEAETRLRAALASGKLPPVWRTIQLDARDALDVGRDEDAVVLAWTAIEAACRQNLPGLAFKAGLTVRELAQRLDRRGHDHQSYEDAVQSQSGGLKVVEVAAELTDPVNYHAKSVRGSVELAYLLRNRIAHQGMRVGRQEARRAVDDVDAALNAALSLRDVTPPPALLSWKARFRRVMPAVEQFTRENSLRLVLSRPRDTYFHMERHGDVLWVSFAADIRQREAMTLMLVEWDAWRRVRMSDRPHLRMGPPSGEGTEGLRSFQMSAVQQAVCLAEALIARLRSDPKVREVASLTVRRQVSALAAQDAIDPNDARMEIFAARLAAQLAVLPVRGHGRRLGALATTQPDVARLARTWAQVMSAIEPDDQHGRCSTLRKIHADSMWMDTIVVACPPEGIAYGSRRWPIDEPSGRE